MRLAIDQMESVKSLAASETLAAVLDRKGRSVFFIEPAATIYDAIERMADRHIGALLVLNEDGRLQGVISERDYARKVILQGKSSRDTAVQEIMTQPVVTATPTMTVHEALQLMTEKRIRHLPIVDPRTDAVEGILSIGDLVRSVIQAQAQTVAHLTSYINGSYPV